MGGYSTLNVYFSCSFFVYKAMRFLQFKHRRIFQAAFTISLKKLQSKMEREKAHP